MLRVEFVSCKYCRYRDDQRCTVLKEDLGYYWEGTTMNYNPPQACANFEEIKWWNSGSRRM